MALRAFTADSTVGALRGLAGQPASQQALTIDFALRALRALPRALALRALPASQTASATDLAVVALIALAIDLALSALRALPASPPASLNY